MVVSTASVAFQMARPSGPLHLPHLSEEPVSYDISVLSALAAKED